MALGDEVQGFGVFGGLSPVLGLKAGEEAGSVRSLKNLCLLPATGTRQKSSSRKPGGNIPEACEAKL